MGLFSFMGNIGAGIVGNRAGKEMQGLGKDMYNEGMSLSESNTRPDFEIPDAVKNANQITMGKQYTNMPGMQLASNQIGQATAQGMSAIEGMSSGAEGIGAISNLYANQMGQERNLASLNAQYKDQASRDFVGSLENLGNWEQKEWAWDKGDPYLQAQATASNLMGKGMDTQMHGLETRAGAWMGTMQGAGSSLDSMAGKAGAVLGLPGLSAMGGM